MRFTNTVIVSVLFLGMSAMNAGADMLDLVKGLPDVYSAGIAVDFTANSGQFVAAGTAMSLDFNDQYDDTDELSPFGSFLLTAVFDANGNPQSGTLTIKDGFDTTLVAGNLSQFGFAPTGSLLEFTFNVTNSSVAGFGSKVGVILTPAGWQGGQAFDGSFNHDFHNTSGGYADTFAVAVPLPGAAWMGMALMGIMGGARVRRRRQA